MVGFGLAVFDESVELYFFFIGVDLVYLGPDTLKLVVDEWFYFLFGLLPLLFIFLYHGFNVMQHGVKIVTPPHLSFLLPLFLLRQQTHALLSKASLLQLFLENCVQTPALLLLVRNRLAQSVVPQRRGKYSFFGTLPVAVVCRKLPF